MFYICTFRDSTYDTVVIYDEGIVMAERFLSLVAENILLKRRLMELGSPKAKNIHTLLLILGGANRGAYGSGACVALHGLGLGDVFDVVVGISTGGWIAGYFLAGEEQIRLGASIYYEDFSGDRFISYRNPWSVMSRYAIFFATREGKKRLDVDAILRSRSELFVAVTDKKGSGLLIDAKKATPDLYAALDASSANPLAYPWPYPLNGAHLWDGGLALPFPIREVCEMFEPTDVLVVPNMPWPPSPYASMMKERVFCELFLRHIPKHIRQLVYTRKRYFVEGLEYIATRKDINIDILWSPDCGVESLTRDPRKLFAAAQGSAEKALAYFDASDHEIDVRCR